MKQFKAKLRKIGNSQGIYIPKEYVSNYNIGDYIELEVITKKEEMDTIADVITHNKKLVFNPKTGINEWK